MERKLEDEEEERGGIFLPPTTIKVVQGPSRQHFSSSRLHWSFKGNRGPFCSFFFSTVAHIRQKNCVTYAIGIGKKGSVPYVSKEEKEEKGKGKGMDSHLTALSERKESRVSSIPLMWCRFCRRNNSNTMHFKNLMIPQVLSFAI